MEEKSEKKIHRDGVKSSDKGSRKGMRSHSVKCSNNVDFDIGSPVGSVSSSDTHLDIFELLTTNVFEANLLGLKTLRKMIVKYTDEILHCTNISFINEVIETGLLPLIVKFLSNTNFLLQEEAAWILTNLATGETRQTRFIVESKAVEGLVNLLMSGYEGVQEKAAWALGNIAGDCSDFRDHVLKMGVADAIVFVLKSSQENLPLMQTTSWLLSILCKDVREVDYERLVPTIPLVRDLLKHWDNDLVAQFAWSLASLSFGNFDRVNIMIDYNVPAYIIPLLSRGDQLIKPALQVIGNIVTADEVPTQVMIDLGIIDQVVKLLDSPNESIRRRSCWILSNITAGSVSQIQSVLDKNPFPKLFRLLADNGIRTKMEICWIMRNVTRGSSYRQITFMVGQGAIEKICVALSIPNDEIVKVCLDTLEAILYSGDSESKSTGLPNEMALIVEKNNGIEVLETLLSHDNIPIYRKTFEILESFFNG